MSLETCKRAAAEKAASLIEDGMTVGLGTGSTIFYFIEALSQRCQAGLKIQAVATSQRSLDQAKAGHIPLVDINSLKALDIAIDGADEIDPEKRMIKGGGGALLREKIVAHMSRELLIIIDESKLVSKLGHHPLPVEVIPFGHLSTLQQLHHLGYHGKWRMDKNSSLYVTDNHNLIYDIQLNPSNSNPAFDHRRMIAIPGVVETGFFLDLSSRVIIGFKDGQVVIQ